MMPILEDFDMMMRWISRRLGVLGFAFLSVGLGPLATSSGQEFRRTVIDADFPGGYQVEVADVSGDGKPDIIGVGGGTCAWYENPGWKKRVITTPKQTPGIISSATLNLIGDARAEVAIAYEFAMNEPSKGKLLVAVPGDGLDAPWTLQPIAAIGSIHRLRWGDLDGDKQPDLVVAPIFGAAAKPPRYDQEGAVIRAYHPKREGNALSWTGGPFGTHQFPVLHAIEVIDLDHNGTSEVLTASNRGVVELVMPPVDSSADPIARPLVPGASGMPPKRGSSEIHRGRLRDGRAFLATIDAWHGGEVAVCLSDKPGSAHFGARTVLDDTLADGHALWVADTDADGDDEVLAGHRGKDHRVSVYDFDPKSGTWSRTVLDSEIAAQDLRGGDLDGDGAPDIVAIGGATHNLVWYKPVTAGRATTPPRRQP